MISLLKCPPSLSSPATESFYSSSSDFRRWSSSSSVESPKAVASSSSPGKDMTFLIFFKLWVVTFVSLLSFKVFEASALGMDLIPF